MNETIDIGPLYSELPSDFADRLGVFYTNKVTIQHKKEWGQFFTPTAIAKLMASLCNSHANRIRMLDPGCGTAVLTCALIEFLTDHNPDIEFIELIAYETDSDLIFYSQKTLNYLTNWLDEKGIKFIYSLHLLDFILENAFVLIDDMFSTPIEAYDIIISNPPYFKLSKEDERTKAAQALVSGQPNIYSIFMGIASKLLKENGELIFITPRSFASGNYFKAFREFFFNTVQIEHIHLFNSRKDTFNRDSVLQETVIVKAIKAKIEKAKQVVVSASDGLNDIFSPTIKYFSSEELIDLTSKEKILHLPTNDKEEVVMSLVSKWGNNLIDYRIQISTGPVVSFRSWDYIQNNYENGTVFLAPLFWLHNVSKMYLQWPLSSKDKGQYIKVESGSMPLLIPNKNYIFLRRFSTKDDKSRLIAAPYFCNYVKASFIGVENKLNYIYKIKGHLKRSEVAGLCALLNSELFDTYFQIFNGNVNVSATELREMRFPSLESINEIGNMIILSNDYSMRNVNKVINQYFKLEAILTLYE